MKRFLSLLTVTAMVLTAAPAAIAQQVLTPLPIVTGDFMQGWQFAGHSRAAISSHFNELSQAGIRYVILTESARRVGSINEVYFPPSPAVGINNVYGNNLIEYMLTAAEASGIKVFLGLFYEGAWWDECWRMGSKTWYTAQAQYSNLIAQELYSLYKDRFPQTFYGWYFSFEYFNNMSGHEANFADFVNINRDFLWDLDPSMPFLMSPFFARDHKNATDTKAELLKFFEYTNFRDGDIYAAQDCVGVGRASLSEAAAYARVIMEARDEKKPGLRLWANNENFNTGNNPVPVSQLIQQINATAPYVEAHITFSYSHHYASILKGANALHSQYRAYYQSVIAGIHFGDIDGNGHINSADVTLLRRYVAAADKAAFLDQHQNFNLRRADVNFDSRVDASDVTLLRRHIAATNPATVPLGP
jgi:hypothetical protein